MGETQFIDTTQFRNHILEHSPVNSLLLLSEKRLASCASDKTIKIYNMNNNYHCDITIHGHTEGVYYTSQLANGKLISCARDQNIKIWTIS